MPIDPDEADYDVDVQIDCVACGCNAVTILEYPRDPNGWWNRFGRARCNFCGAEFSIELEEPDDE